MKTAFLSAAGLALALPFTSLATTSTVTIPDGEYRLVAAWRLAGGASGTGIAQLYLLQETNFVVSTFVLGTWAPDFVLFPGQGGIAGASGGNETLGFQQHAAPVLPLNLQPGFNLVCCQTDMVASYEDIVGRPPDEGVRVYQFNAGPGSNPFHLGPPDYTIYTFSGGAWSPTNPVVGITEAVFVDEPPHLANARVTAEGFTFDVAAPLNAAVTVQYSDSLSPPSWEVLTNVVGNGVSVEVTDPAGATGAERYYRVKIAQ